MVQLVQVICPFFTLALLLPPLHPLPALIQNQFGYFYGFVFYNFNQSISSFQDGMFARCSFSESSLPALMSV